MLKKFNFHKVYWPEDERSRKRLIKYGSNALADAHLLGILTGSGDRRAKKMR